MLSPGPITTVPVTVAGRELTLEYNLATLNDAIEALGFKNLDELLTETDKFAGAINDAGQGGHAFYKVSLRVLSVMLWAGSHRTAGEDAPTADAIALSTRLSDYPTLLVAVATAMTLCIRHAKAEEPEAPSPEAAAAA